MNLVDIKKLYLGVYTTDGKHIPESLNDQNMLLIQNCLMNDQSTESLIGDIVWRLRSLVLAKSILAVPYYNASTH